MILGHGDPRSVYEGAAIFERMADAPAERVVKPACHRSVVLGQSNQNPEGRFPGGEITGTVDRIDDPDLTFGHLIHNRRICGEGFLTHQLRTRCERG